MAGQVRTEFNIEFLFFFFCLKSEYRISLVPQIWSDQNRMISQRGKLQCLKIVLGTGVSFYSAVKTELCFNDLVLRCDNQKPHTPEKNAFCSLHRIETFSIKIDFCLKFCLSSPFKVIGPDITEAITKAVNMPSSYNKVYFS